jgi:acetyl-CoA acetyltransferase
MLNVAERKPMGRKKSETRKHTAMVRIEAGALEQAKLAASLTRAASVSDYITGLVVKAAAKDIGREARKLAGGPDQ